MLYAAEVGYVGSAVRISPIHLVFGLTTLPLAAYCHLGSPSRAILSPTTLYMPHIVCELERSASLHSVLYTLLHRHLQHRVSNTISSTASTFSIANNGFLSPDSTRNQITATTMMEVPCCYPRIYLSKSNTPAPSVRPPITFLQTLRPHPLRPCFPT